MSHPPHAPSGGPPNSFANRRRSISRSSRSSLGGKPIPGPHYGSTIRRADPNDSAIHSELGSGSEDGFTRLIGSFSATREELRDGSARLAALASSQNGGSPFDDDASSPNLDSNSPSADAVAASTSPSGLALGRPPQLNKTLGDRLAASGGRGESTLPTILSNDSSPESNNELTPTQSNIGSLAPISGVTPPAPAGDLGTEQTPTPARMASRERAKRDEEQRDREECKEHQPRVMGDERGGNNRDADEEELLHSQMVIREEDEEGSDDGRSQTSSLRRRHQAQHQPQNGGDERTPLLAHSHSSAHHQHHAAPPQDNFVQSAKKQAANLLGEAKAKVKSLGKEDVIWVGKTSVRSIPAVLLGTLMNVLDGVSYGLITFPTQIPAFANFGGIGVSMFFVSCIVAQLVFSSGGSIFKGGNGSMMIEVVPFYHAIVAVLQANITDDKTLVATTMFAFAMSSVLTGLAFGLLGLMKLGRLSEFFPRHILVGTIGGVGAFLFITGLQVSARTEDAGMSWALVQHYFDKDTLPLWTVPLVLAVILRLITARYSHPLIFPGYFLAIPIVFYAVAFAAGFSVDDLRASGWVFEVSNVDNSPFEWITLYDLKHTDFGAILETIPTQLALVFFGLLHVPINVPSLAISIGEDNVSTDRELVAHGVSNVLSGLIGSVPNYLVYVNSVLFYQVGGDTRLSGFLLAGGSVGMLLLGPGVIGYLPVCVVAALIYILGVDLVKEAVWDTYGRVSNGEYVTIWAIVLIMTGADFVWGLLAGLTLASVHFVILSSQRRAIRTILTGTAARSTVRRHPKQSAFLTEVGRQIRVVKLQGFLFFGTISNVEATVRKLLDAASWSSNPIRFLVVDFSMASGVDFSAAEAFVRMQRLLQERGVVLVLCGCPADSSVGIALRSVDLWSEHPENEVVVLENLNDALEHCENQFLRSLYSKTFRPPALAANPNASAYQITSQIDMPKADLESDIEGFAGSPRANHLRTAARETISRAETPQTRMNFAQPLPILLQAFQPYSPELNEDYCFRLVPYFKRVNIPRGTSLWTSGSEPDAFYVIESGMLRANYTFADRSNSMVESMVAGTVAGEMSFLSRTKRNTDVVAERDSVLWKMDVQAHEELGKKEGWQFGRRFEEVVLKIAVAETEVLMGHLMTRT